MSQGYIESEWGANVPLSVIWSQFQLPADEFEATYGARKPALDDEIIVTCRSGGRSTVAQKILQELGKIISVVDDKFLCFEFRVHECA